MDFDDPRPRSGSASIGRLKRGVSAAEANAELAVYHQPLLREYGLPNPRWQEVFKASMFRSNRRGQDCRRFFGRQYSAPLYLMQGLVGIVLLLCCVNVSGLMLSKLHERQHEFAVRTAIGAGRTRLMRQYLTESFVIALAAPASARRGPGTAARGCGQFFRDPMSSTALDVQPGPDRVLRHRGTRRRSRRCSSASCPRGRRAAPIPARCSSRARAAQRQIAGRGFVAVQVALSLVLVVLATLLSHEPAAAARASRPGSRSITSRSRRRRSHLLPGETGERSSICISAWWNASTRRPGSTSAAVTWYTPMTGYQATATFQALADGASTPRTSTLAFNSVGAGYFRTMQTAILSRARVRAARARARRLRGERVGGRAAVPASAGDRPLRPDAARNSARPAAAAVRPRRRCAHHLPDRRRRRGREVREPARAAAAHDLLPHHRRHRRRQSRLSAERADEGGRGGGLSRSAARDRADDAAGAVRDAAGADGRGAREPARDHDAEHVLRRRGAAAQRDRLYGMLSSNVSQRTGEIGIRVALGASRGTILRMVFSDALRLVAIGVALGAVGLFFAEGTDRALCSTASRRSTGDGGRDRVLARPRRVHGEPLAGPACRVRRSHARHARGLAHGTSEPASLDRRSIQEVS